MKLVKSITVAAVVMSLSNLVYANNVARTYQVPFYNVAIDGTKKIYAEYSFEPHSQTLVCKMVSGDGIETVGWEYKGARYKGQLPLELKDDASFNGQWADPSGKLVISNVFENDPILVTCEYSNKK